MNNFISIFGLALFIALVLAMLSPKANADDYHDRFWSEYDGSMSRAEYARHRAVEMAAEGDHTTGNSFINGYIAGRLTTPPIIIQRQESSLLPQKRSVTCNSYIRGTIQCYEN